MSHPPQVAVLGAGIMGRGIARAFAASGSSVRVREVNLQMVERGRESLEGDLARSVARGSISGVDRDSILTRISWTCDLSEAVDDAELVIEAAPEQLDLKKSLFEELDTLAPSNAILASNTSALSITSIANATTSPERVIGLHFFNPVHRMSLVEVVIGTATDHETVERSTRACATIGKQTIEVADRPGFATSRVNAMIGNEAFTMLMEGVASAEDIDLGMKLALNHPMGPFELVDLVGLDTRLAVLRRLHEALGERFRPSPLLANLVEAGRLGRKTGQGVYRYDEQGNRIPDSAAVLGVFRN